MFSWPLSTQENSRFNGEAIVRNYNSISISEKFIRSMQRTEEAGRGWLFWISSLFTRFRLHLKEDETTQRQQSHYVLCERWKDVKTKPLKKDTSPPPPALAFLSLLTELRQWGERKQPSTSAFHTGSTRCRRYPRVPHPAASSFARSIPRDCSAACTPSSQSPHEC